MGMPGRTFSASATAFTAARLYRAFAERCGYLRAPAWSPGERQDDAVVLNPPLPMRLTFNAPARYVAAARAASPHKRVRDARTPTFYMPGGHFWTA